MRSAAPSCRRPRSGSHFSRYDENFTPQRKVYQRSFSQAASKLSTGQVVSSIQRMGAIPDGASTSWASTAQSISAPSDFLFFGGCKLTRAKRISKRATRARCARCRGT